MNASETFKTSSMKSMLGVHLLRNGLSTAVLCDQSKMSLKLLPGPNSIRMRGSLTLKQGTTRSVFGTVNKLVKNTLGFKILQVGGVEKLFRQIFSLREGEQLLKASQCCLFTTAGPIQGRLFISTHRLAFCSDRPIAKCTSPTGESHRFHYKVVIPLNKINKVNESKNLKNPSQKYLQVTTTDDFEFWFMGFLNYKRTYRYLQQAISNTLV